MESSLSSSQTNLKASLKKEKEDPKTKIFALEVLNIIKTSQNQHGLRHADYQRYRNYCTRRGRRIRRSLGWTHGKNKFVKRNVDAETLTDQRFLLLVLTKAERAWAYAMQLKDDAANDVRVKYHMHRRLAKAVTYAKHLERLCSTRADKKSNLEAEAYAAYMSGSFLLEKEKWDEALQFFVKSRTIYEQLGKVGEPEYAELCKQRVEEIDPSIRYCNYNLKGKKGADSDTLIQMKMESKGPGMDLLQAKLDSVIAESLQRQSESMREILWNGNRIPLKNDKVRMYILNAQEASYELERTQAFESKMPLYDKLFVAYNDAIRVTKDDITALAVRIICVTYTCKAKKGGTQAQEEGLNLLKNYISYLKATKTIERNQLMASIFENRLLSPSEIGNETTEKRSKPEDIVKVYDNLLQNATELSELTTGDPEQTKEIAAKALSFKALRCYYLGLSYLYAGKSPEALALLDRAKEQISAAKAHHEACSSPNKDFLQKLAETDGKIRSYKCEAHAKTFLQSIETKKQQESPRGTKSNNYLLDSLDTFDYSIAQSKHLIAFPPQLEPTKCKPLFFDLTGSSINYPSLEARTKAKGWLSFWR